MIGFLCRNKEGIALLYNYKPEKDIEHGDWFEESEEYFVLLDRELPEGINPQWEDDEPIEVEITLKKIE